MKTALLFVLALIVSLSTSQSAHADVGLPKVFGDHMVLQQKAKIKVWGWTDANDPVTVSLGENSVETTADQGGRWQVELEPMEASKTPLTMVVKGSHNTIELKDVLIGEVWLCSGQSNMEWSVAASKNSKEEIAAANFPLIRHIKVDRRPSSEPQDDIESKLSWQACSPETAGQFTGCGYFMARKLHQDLDVPIGLINSSWGGTRVEPWTPPVGFEKVDALKSIHGSVLGRTPGTDCRLGILA